MNALAKNFKRVKMKTKNVCFFNLTNFGCCNFYASGSAATLIQFRFGWVGCGFGNNNLFKNNSATLGTVILELE
jgi:hypothetical protein